MGKIYSFITEHLNYYCLLKFYYVDDSWYELYLLCVGSRQGFKIY